MGNVEKKISAKKKHRGRAVHVEITRGNIF
jgi:hypothetical protein